ncbi:alanine:cation symporter family protein, partial [Psychromonas arctica]
MDIVKGKYTDPNSIDEGEVSHFQALTTGLSGSVCLGNIAGVGGALAIGGT